MLELNFTPFPQLRTKRLLLRAIEPWDAQAMFALRSDPRVMEHIGRPLAQSLADAEKLMADMRSNFEARTGITWAITQHGDHELAGTIGFWRSDAAHHYAELGYMLKPQLWGKGLMREAAAAVIWHGFHTLRFHRIEARLDPDNTASKRVLEAVGFEFEGRLRQNFFFEDVFYDTLVYGLLDPAPPVSTSA